MQHGILVREVDALDIDGQPTGVILPLGTGVLVDIALVGNFNEDGQLVSSQVTELRFCQVKATKQEVWINRKDINTELI